MKLNTLESQADTDRESDVVIEHTEAEAEVAAENTASALEDDAVKPQDANNKSTQDAATAGQSSTEQTDTD